MYHQYTLWIESSTVLDLCIFLSWLKKVVFLLEKLILWIKDLYFICKQRIEVQKFWIRSLQTYSLLLHKKLNDGLKLCGLLVDYCDVWVLIWRHPFIVEIHCWASDAMLISPNLFLWRNKLIYILDGLRMSKFLANLHFCLNFSFNIF